MKKTNKLYVVKKYIWAESASQAIKLEKKHNVDDVWVDEDWKRNSSSPKDSVGFLVENQDE